MFYHLEGLVAELEPNLAVLDCGGVGYALSVSAGTVSQLSLGKTAKLYVSESIGETNFDLYGFLSKQEKRCFEMLTGVSGVGPKAALSILSFNPPERLAMAILNGDEKALTVAPGIGKKIAQRVILELKDKISKEAGGFELPYTAAAAAPPQDGSMGEAMAALSVLGYSAAEINPILRGLDTQGMTSEQIIRAVLRQMVK